MRIELSDVLQVLRCCRHPWFSLSAQGSAANHSVSAREVSAWCWQASAVRERQRRGPADWGARAQGAAPAGQHSPEHHAPGLFLPSLDALTLALRSVKLLSAHCGMSKLPSRVGRFQRRRYLHMVGGRRCWMELRHTRSRSSRSGARQSSCQVWRASPSASVGWKASPTSSLGSRWSRASISPTTASRLCRNTLWRTSRGFRRS